MCAADELLSDPLTYCICSWFCTNNSFEHLVLILSILIRQVQRWATFFFELEKHIDLEVQKGKKLGCLLQKIGPFSSLSFNGKFLSQLACLMDNSLNNTAKVQYTTKYAVFRTVFEKKTTLFFMKNQH